MKFFQGLSRSLGTKTGILLLPPTLDIQSATVHAYYSQFPEESTVQHLTMATLQDTANTPPQMLLDNPGYTIHMSSVLKKALQNGPKAHVPEKSLEMDTHQATPHHVDVPVPNGIHCIEQIRYPNLYVTTCHRRMMPHIGCQLLHRDVFGKLSLFHALGANSSMTEPTINSTLCVFIEQVNNCDLQKMVLQFTTFCTQYGLYLYGLHPA